MKPWKCGYKMPAEWVQHARTFVSWPVQDSMCYPEDYAMVCGGYADIIEAIAEFEPVTVIVNKSDLEQMGRHIHNSQIEYLLAEHNDSWFRDNGPTFVVNWQGELAAVNWSFNAWGGKYAPWDMDDLLAEKILEHENIRAFHAPLVMEGGSIHVDGEGTLLTTEECLLNPNRNPGLNRSEVEIHLREHLGVEKVVWLKRGLSGDETDGHVDNIACFAAPGRIMMQVCHDPEDENHEICRENVQILSSITDAQGRQFEIIPIEQAPPMFHNNRRLTLSYLNFYFVNGGIILPVFGGRAAAADQQAIRVLSHTFPQRRIRTVNGMAVIREGGNVHCMTQQMPAAGR